MVRRIASPPVTAMTALVVRMARVQAAQAVRRQQVPRAGIHHVFLLFRGQRPALAEARRKLFEAREQRLHPGRDEKVLTSCNGLMLAAFAEAARALERDDYRQVAKRNAGFLLRELRQDNATPSGSTMAVIVLLKLAGFTNELRYVDIALQALAQMHAMAAQYPLGFGQWLQALSYTLAKPKEIAIIGKRQQTDTQAMLRVAAENYQPFQSIAFGGSKLKNARHPTALGPQADRRACHGIRVY